MLKIKVPATSANLCVGFDTLGIAFNLYNEFSFDISTEDQLIGFDSRYIHNNLVLESYKRFFKEFNLDYIPVNISLLNEGVPTSRGLGSSATCIVAGVIGAYYITKKVVDFKKVCDLCVNIEGHPDNVIPAILGGFCASLKNDNQYEFIKYDVSKELKFYALIPDFELETHVSREVIPNQYSREDVIHNLSRIVNLPYAFKTGDMTLIKKILNDKIHEPYRFPIINGAVDVCNYFKDDNVSVIISGAGPTLLLICDRNYSLKNSDIFGFKAREVKCVLEGIVVDEL